MPVLNGWFGSAPVSMESWFRIVGVGVLASMAVGFEKWVRFGRARGCAIQA
jgi:Ca2+-transporting ATPase